jgi:very-short-patch-repair endonuclease
MTRDRSRRQRPAPLPFEDLYAAGDARRLAPTRAEAALAAILDELGGGALRGEYRREWPVGEWWADFYFPSIRLAIEVDGGYHRAQSRWRLDQRKAADLEARGITLLRLANPEVFGDRLRLVERLRTAWRQAALRTRRETRAQPNLVREPAAPYGASAARPACLYLPYMYPRLQGVGLRKLSAPALQTSTWWIDTQCCANAYAQPAR